MVRHVSESAGVELEGVIIGSELSAMGIATDSVGRDRESTPRRRDIRMIRNFMLSFGLLSTVFDLLTFTALLYLAGESVDRFSPAGPGGSSCGAARP